MLVREHNVSVCDFQVAEVYDSPLVVHVLDFEQLGGQERERAGRCGSQVKALWLSCHYDCHSMFKILERERERAIKRH